MEVLLLSALQEGRRISSPPLPALDLLSHDVWFERGDPAAAVAQSQARVVLVDTRGDLVAARKLCRLVRSARLPQIAIVNEGDLAAISSDWGIDDVVLNTAGPAELDARLRLIAARNPQIETTLLQVAELVIDPQTYSARVRGRPLDLTFKEFELLRFLAQHPARVFTRQQLLQQVWGYDYYGGTRTVDVHVRRLRAKLGNEHESLIGTVRHVGYRFSPPREVHHPS